MHVVGQCLCQEHKCGKKQRKISDTGAPPRMVRHMWGIEHVSGEGELIISCIIPRVV